MATRFVGVNEVQARGFVTAAKRRDGQTCGAEGTARCVPWLCCATGPGGRGREAGRGKEAGQIRRQDCMGCTCTHLLHAHFSAHRACTVTSAHLHTCAHARMAQVSVKRCLHMCRFSPFRILLSLMFHPSLLFLYIHFDITFLVHVLAVLSRPESARHAHLHTCIAKFGYLAKSDANTGYEPNKFDKNTSVDDDTMLINDPNHNTSDFSKTTNRNTGLFGVLTMLESSVSHVYDFALQIESKESMHRETDCLTEREKERERFCDQCCIINVKEMSTEPY